jgi:hypothetical protein
VVRSGLGSCPMAGFSVSSAEPLGFVTIVR